MHDGEALYAIGWFRTETNIPAGTADEEAGALLREWKRDPTGLLRRFDANRDGTLDLAEWERARAAAHEQIAAERRQQSPLAGVNVLQRPIDRAAAFLIAAITRPTVSGLSEPACQPVPYRAVRRTAASDEPPIHIGNSACSGSGEIEALVNWKCFPA